nr:unnamed protein product [uncultured bacterium]
MLADKENKVVGFRPTATDALILKDLKDYYSRTLFMEVSQSEIIRVALKRLYEQTFEKRVWD